MEVWRRKFQNLFPEIHKDLWDDESLSMCFSCLLSAAHKAHRSQDAQQLSKIYGFAEWCLNQKQKELWNPAGVSFYEHVFDCEQELWPEVLSWLSEPVIRDVHGLWEIMLKPDLYQELKTLLDKRSRKRTIHGNIYTLNTIQD